jgi:hypothetical protein
MVRIPDIARAPPRLRERDQSTMATKFPHQLVITHLGWVENVDLAPMLVRRANTGLRLQPPVDRMVEPKVSVTKQIVSAGKQAIGAGPQRGELGIDRSQGFQRGIPVVEGREKRALDGSAGRGVSTKQPARIRFTDVADASSLEPARGALSCAIEQFGGRSATQLS